MSIYLNLCCFGFAEAESLEVDESKELAPAEETKQPSAEEKTTAADQNV